MPFINKEETVYVKGAPSRRVVRKLMDRRDLHPEWVTYAAILASGVAGTVLMLCWALLMQNAGESWILGPGLFLFFVPLAVAILILETPLRRKELWDRGRANGWLITSEDDTFTLIMTDDVKRAVKRDSSARSAVDAFFSSYQCWCLDRNRPSWIVEEDFERQEGELLENSRLLAVARTSGNEERFLAHVRNIVAQRYAAEVKKAREAKSAAVTRAAANRASVNMTDGVVDAAQARVELLESKMAATISN